MLYRKLVTKTLQCYWRLTRSLHLDVAAIVRDGNGHVLLVRERREGAPWRLPGGPVVSGLTAQASLRRALTRTLPAADSLEFRLIDIVWLEPDASPTHVAVYEARVTAAAGTNFNVTCEIRFAPPDRLPQPLAAGIPHILNALTASGAAQQS